MAKKEKAGIRASFYEMWSRLTCLFEDSDTKKKIYFNGYNNLYPYDVEAVISNSPTASRGAKIMAKYISGKGLVDETKDVIVNVKENHKLSNVISFAAESIARQYGVFIHVSYGYDGDENTGLKIVPKELKVLDYCQCRKAKEDYNGFDGIIIQRDWLALTDKAVDKKNVTSEWYYPFNKNQNVVLAQIKKDSEDEDGNPEQDPVKAIQMYRGQVFYLNLTPSYKYAMPPVSSVYDDADTEARFAIYTNTQFRSGFLGKTAVITQGLDSEQSKVIEDNLSKFLGSENSGSIFHLDIESTDDIDKVIKFTQLKGQFDDKLFDSNDARVRRNILGAFNNVPEPLVLASSSLFGTSGDTYREMKIFYSEQTEDERKRLQETFTYLGFPCEIKPMVETTTETQANANT